MIQQRIELLSCCHMAIHNNRFVVRDPITYSNPKSISLSVALNVVCQHSFEQEDALSKNFCMKLVELSLSLPQCQYRLFDTLSTLALLTWKTWVPFLK